MRTLSWWKKPVLSFLVLYILTLTNVACVGIPNNLNVQDLTPPQQDWQFTPSIFDPEPYQATQSVVSTQQFQITQWAQMTQEQKDAQNHLTLQIYQQQATQTATVLLQNPQITQGVDLQDKLVWKAGFETGNIDEWNAHGGFISQGSSGMYSMVTPFAHTGNYAVAITIDTNAPSDTGAHAAYLFYWDQLPEDAYYYSAWYYIPSEVSPKGWWIIMQWKSTYDNNSDHSVPMYVIDVTKRGNNLWARLIYRPDSSDQKVIYSQNVVSIPTNQWFQLEAYYMRAKDDTGQVIVWQDGVEVFNLSNTDTVSSDGTIYWSVNNYSDDIDPHPCTISVDDIAISITRLGVNPLP